MGAVGSKSGEWGFPSPRNLPTHKCTSCTIRTGTQPRYYTGRVRTREGFGCHVLRSALSDRYCSMFSHKTASAVQPCHFHLHPLQLFSSFQRRVQLPGCNGGGRWSGWECCRAILLAGDPPPVQGYLASVHREFQLVLLGGVPSFHELIGLPVADQSWWVLGLSRLCRSSTVSTSEWQAYVCIEGN